MSHSHGEWIALKKSCLTWCPWENCNLADLEATTEGLVDCDFQFLGFLPQENYWKIIHLGLAKFLNLTADFTWQLQEGKFSLK